MNSRLAGAILAVRQAVATAGDIPLENIEADEDFVDDLVLDELELESFGLIVEDVFGIPVDPESLFRTPLYRTAASLAEWLIRSSDAAAWKEARR